MKFIVQLRSYLVLFLCCFNWSAAASDAQAILVWSSFDGEHHVVASSLIEDKWSDPEIIHTSENLIVTPSLAKSSDGQMIMVWSEQQQGKMEIFQAALSNENGNWGEAQPIIDEGSENLNPNIVNDGQGGLWLFWSGNDGGLDDIYYKNKVIGESEWSDTRQLNAPNEVPDYKPVAELDQFGDILVRWQTYDFLTGQYIEAQEIIEIEQKTGSSATLAASDLDLEDIILPKFLPHDSAVSLLFPNNTAAQSIRLDE